MQIVNCKKIKDRVLNKIIRKYRNRLVSQYKMIIIFIFLLPTCAWADSDPLTKSGTEMGKILFGTLGSTLCAIIIGATFLMAKVGKVSWEKFIQVGLCSAGFLGAPSIVMLMKSWVG